MCVSIFKLFLFVFQAPPETDFPAALRHDAAPAFHQRSGQRTRSPEITQNQNLQHTCHHQRVRLATCQQCRRRWWWWRPNCQERKNQKPLGQSWQTGHASSCSCQTAGSRSATQVGPGVEPPVAEAEARKNGLCRSGCSCRSCCCCCSCRLLEHHCRG